MSKQGFLQAAADRFGARGATYAASCLRQFGLPEPEEGQFYATNIHSGKLPKLILFLERFGLAFRFYEPFFIPENDLILQPLAKAETECLDVDIVPVVPVGIDESDLSRLEKSLLSQGIEWGDPGAHNAAYVGGRDHAVVVDLCETIICRPNCANRLDAEGSLQVSAFHDLREAGAALFGEDGHAETDAARHFLRTAFERKARGAAPVSMISQPFAGAAGWDQTAKALSASASYAQRLECVA